MQSLPRLPDDSTGRTSDLPELSLIAVLQDHLHQRRWCRNQACCLHTWVPGTLSAYRSTLIGCSASGQGEVALFADTFMRSLYCCMFCGNWVRNLELGVVSCLGWEGVARLEAQSSPLPHTLSFNTAPGVLGSVQVGVPQSSGNASRTEYVALRGFVCPVKVVI